MLSETAKTVDTSTHKDDQEETKEGGPQKVSEYILDNTEEDHEEILHDEEEEEEINFD